MNILNWHKSKERRVVVHLSGGLGNQLFQFLKASEIAKQNDMVLILNLNWFESPKYLKPGYKTNPNKRKPELLRFEKVSKYKIENSRLPRDGRFERLLSIAPVDRLISLGIVSDGIVYNSNRKLFRNSLRVVGYHVANTIPKNWNINQELGNLAGYEFEENINSIGIHVRLGDYLDQNYIIVPTEKYYLSAIKEAQKVIPNPSISIFTDDPDHLKRHFPLLINKAVKIISTSDPILDLLGLSANKVIIASNSTYSWWSTQLGIEKMLIIHPIQYFTNPMRDKMEAPIWPKGSLAIDPISGIS